MHLTDIFIKRPVLATVVSLLILVLGIRALFSLPIRQYPFTQNAVVTVTTSYTGADPSVIAGFITTPLENSIAQANGIDYLTSFSQQSVSTIQAYLRLNYDSDKALNEINTKVNAVLNQLPREAQQPIITIDVGQTIDAAYIGFYSKVLSGSQITDYLTRVVQPKLQAVEGVQEASILGGRQFAMRAWLDPVKLAGFGLTPANISTALSTNDLVSAAGRTDGGLVTENLKASTNLSTVSDFRKMVIQAKDGAIIRLGDVAKVDLGATNYDTSVAFDGQPAIYIGIKVAPTANLLTVVKKIREVFPSVQQQLPQGLRGEIVYDSTKFVTSSIHEVLHSLGEALLIVTIVIFLFLGSIRSVLIPLVTIPLSLIGAFFIMLILGYSINLLTLLAFVLGIGLVVDDAIIVVENIQRHLEEGLSYLQAAIQGARELASPILAITVVLIAVYLPIGFMEGLTGALFTEFAFTLAAAVTVSAVIALTLSPMMCSRFLRHNGTNSSNQLLHFVDRQFDKLHRAYAKLLEEALRYLPVIAVFAGIILVSIYFLYATAKTELAPQEDQGLIIGQLTAAPNASLKQTELYTQQMHKKYMQFPETEHTFALTGINGLNTAFSGMILKPWGERHQSSNELQPLVQKEFDKISGATIAAFQPPSLPGSRGLPIQFVIGTTEPFSQLYEVTKTIMDKAMASGLFMFLDSDLKIDKAETHILLDRDKTAQLGLTMQQVAQALSGALSQGYINYFNFDGRSYQVIPQIQEDKRLNTNQLLNYYLTTSSGSLVPLSTIATLKQVVVPETLNHFQQLNAATISGVPFLGVTMGDALEKLKEIANSALSPGYTIDYAGESRQLIQEGGSLIVTFFFALIIIFLALSALFESFRDPLIVLISVPMSICGALIFVSLGLGGASLNIYTEVGLVTLIGLISKHGILIVQFANDLQREGKQKLEAVIAAASIRLRPILMTTAAMVLGVVPLIFASGAGAVSRFNIGIVIAGGLSIGTLFTLFVVPAMYLFLAADHSKHLQA